MEKRCDFMYRKTYAIIDGNQLEENVKKIKNKYSGYTYYIGVVKNNAYSHGFRVVRNLIKGGINYLAVSSLDEALSVRKFSRTIPILVLEPIDLEYMDDVMNNKITITVESLDYVKELNKINLPFTIKIHLKIDTGMNRLGFKTNKDVKEAIKIILKNDKLELEGIYSHFASSGIADVYYDQQLNTFLKLTKGIDLKEIPIVHLDRSLTLVTHEKLAFVTGVRLGIVLYGFSQNRRIIGLKGKLRELKRQLYLKRKHISKTILTNDLDVKEAFGLYSTVMSIRKVTKNEFVGYNASYKVKEDGFIATIPIGYADGVSKEFQYVVIHKKKYKIVADSMDMLMVLVDKNVKVKDKVEIFGDTISIKEVARTLNTNAYHVLNTITNRVPRIHKENDDTIEINY